MDLHGSPTSWTLIPKNKHSPRIWTPAMILKLLMKLFRASAMELNMRKYIIIVLHRTSLDGTLTETDPILYLLQGPNVNNIYILKEIWSSDLNWMNDLTNFFVNQSTRVSENSSPTPGPAHNISVGLIDETLALGWRGQASQSKVVMKVGHKMTR